MRRRRGGLRRLRLGERPHSRRRMARHRPPLVVMAVVAVVAVAVVVVVVVVVSRHRHQLARHRPRLVVVAVAAVAVVAVVGVMTPPTRMTCVAMATLMTGVVSMTLMTRSANESGGDILLNRDARAPLHQRVGDRGRDSYGTSHASSPGELPGIGPPGGGAVTWGRPPSRRQPRSVPAQCEE